MLLLPPEVEPPMGGVNMKLLEMYHVRKQFDGLVVLKDISLFIEEREVAFIIGSPGSGKSTLLRCATILFEDYQGAGKRAYDHGDRYP